MAIDSASRLNSAAVRAFFFTAKQYPVPSCGQHIPILPSGYQVFTGWPSTVIASENAKWHRSLQRDGKQQ
ncbi:hypothetical protein [Ktedonospora formicarum]|uniref:hypothetical protein n=1 Tax=Ktedonospora formicarum TaxID=2778364 RepID=UPI001C68F1E7|nr:hypothetical protein [Ktedonospora formicarum]